ncbi:hypothetical protein ABZ544_30800, partial [Micromonospora sediminicola]
MDGRPAGATGGGPAGGKAVPGGGPSDGTRAGPVVGPAAGGAATHISGDPDDELAFTTHLDRRRGYQEALRGAGI